MILRTAAVMALVLAAWSSLALDSASAIPASTGLREDGFTRISFAGEEAVEALRLSPPDGKEPAAILVVGGKGVSIRPEPELGMASALEGDASIRPARLNGSLVLRFGDGTYSRTLFESGRASTFSLSARDRELSLRYVVIPEGPGRQAGFAIAWRLYERNRLVESGWETLPLRTGRKEELTLKPVRGRAVASLTLQIDDDAAERKN